MKSLILQKREHIADGTMAFWFKPEQSFEFVAGQCGSFFVNDISHYFSFANAPHEELFIATRMRNSQFKNSLKDMPLGSTISMEGPMGDFVLPKDTTLPIMFIVGGIGITPVRSMIRWSLQHNSGHRMTLLYANRTLEATAFFDEFVQLSKHDTFRFVPTLSDNIPADWKYERGRIDLGMIQKYAKDLQRTLFYIVGPPAMVFATRDLLFNYNIPKENVIIEDFGGY